MPDRTEGTGVWVYAICAGIGNEHLSGVRGVGGEPIVTIEAAGLAAVVGSVGLDQFGEQALREDLENLERVTQLARAHHRVVEAVSHVTAVVPTRLATVYRDDERVRATLSERATDIEAALRRVAGRQEWGVKAYGSIVAGGEEAPSTAPAAPGSGTAYLSRRRAQLSARERARQIAHDDADAVHRRLAEIAEASRLHAPQDPQLSGARGWMVLNGAYLVESRRADEFGAVLTELTGEHPGLRLQLTGPWPPYSFAAIAAVAEPEGEP